VGLAAVFEESANNPGARLASPDLERRLHEILDACRAAWPGLGVPDHAFVRHLAENLLGHQVAGPAADHVDVTGCARTA
jgi:hypothetical protein